MRVKKMLVTYRSRVRLRSLLERIRENPNFQFVENGSSDESTRIAILLVSLRSLELSFVTPWYDCWQDLVYDNVRLSVEELVGYGYSMDEINACNLLIKKIWGKP